MATPTSLKQFSQLLRSSLDMEDLLRTTLERMLAECGAMNLVCYLVGRTGDYKLGAYINATVPKDSVETLLDHWAGVIPDRFAETGLAVATPKNEAERRKFTDGDPWLRDSHLALIGVDHAQTGLRLGCFQFSRESKPFSDAEVQGLRDLVGLFRDQLWRILTIHNRLKPDFEGTGGLVDGDDDEEQESA